MKKGRQGMTVLDIFKQNQNPIYPQLLIKYLNSDELNFQLQKAEYLLNLWTDDYIKMPQISKSTYYNIILKFLKSLYNVYVTKKRGGESLAKLYYLFYKKWPEVTQNVKKGLSQSNINTLQLFWSISFNMVRAINLVQRQQFGLFIAQNFQKSLSQYKWKTHAEKIYILQILKYINNQTQYQSFIENGKIWTQIIKVMKNEPFQSQIEKNKGQLGLKVYKYQYEQIKLARHNQPKSQKFQFNKSNKSNNDNKTNKNSFNPNIFYFTEKRAEFQKQYFKREQINIFLVVKNEQQEKQIYRIELLSQIISCRPLMCLICEDFWQSLTFQVITQILQKLETMNADVKTDMLLAKMFLSILKYRKTSSIIRQKVGQQIIVNIIKNIQLFGHNSPFQTPELSQLPTLVNQAFLYISPKMKVLQITVQSIINKRIKSIIEQANIGKDDIVNRSFMTVSCRQQLTLKLATLKQVKHFLIGCKKKKNLGIQTVMILVKILLKAHKSPDFKQLNAFLLAQALTVISQNYLSNPKVNQLRKLNIQLIKIQIPIIANNQQIVQGQYGLLIINILQWMQVVQINFKIVYAPMIHILIMLIKRYREYFLTDQNTIDYLQKILSGMMQKLGHEHNSQNMYAFFDCLLLAYIRLQWNAAAYIFDQIPTQSFITWQTLYRKQATCLFKKQQQIKWNQKKQIERKKQQRQPKFVSLIKRKQAIQSGNRKQSSYYQESTDIINNNSIFVDLAQQKKCQQIMRVYFGQLEKGWLKQMINNYDLWNNQSLISAQLACLQYSLIQTIKMVQKQYYIKAQRPNQYIKEIILSLDEDIQKLFAFLMNSQSYQLLFLFASKIFFICRDYFFVKKLKSYQLLINKCFQILSVFFNKIQILYACSTFASLLLAYANSPQLKNVYDQLNQQQYITDLFKGSNQFIGKQKYYYPWLIKILMAYQITQKFRIKLPLVRQSLQTLGKNLLWWSNVDYLINPQIDVIDSDVEESKILIFDAFRQQYKKLMNEYFKYVENTIQAEIMNNKIMKNK